MPQVNLPVDGVLCELIHYHQTTSFNLNWFFYLLLAKYFLSDKTYFFLIELLGLAVDFLFSKLQFYINIVSFHYFKSIK